MSSDSLAHRIPMQFGAHWFSCLKAPWDASWQIPGVQDQAGSSSNLFPVDINFASILFQVTFGTAVFTKAMNGWRPDETPVFAVGKGSWLWLGHSNEFSVPGTSDGSSGPESLFQQHDGEHTALVLGSIS